MRIGTPPFSAREAPTSSGGRRRPLAARSSARRCPGTAQVRLQPKRVAHGLRRRAPRDDRRAGSSSRRSMAAAHSSGSRRRSPRRSVHDLREGADAAHDHGRAVAHGLGRGQAEGLVAERGHEQRQRPAIEGGQRGGMDLARKRTWGRPRACSRSAALVGARARDDEVGLAVVRRRGADRSWTPLSFSRRPTYRKKGRSGRAVRDGVGGPGARGRSAGRWTSGRSTPSARCCSRAKRDGTRRRSSCRSARPSAPV